MTPPGTLQHPAVSVCEGIVIIALREPHAALVDQCEGGPVVMLDLKDFGAVIRLGRDLARAAAASIGLDAEGAAR